MPIPSFTPPGSVHAIVKELLARDLVVLVDRVDADFFAGLTTAGRFRRDVEGEVNDELIAIRAIVKWTRDVLAMEEFIPPPIFRLPDHRLLPQSLLTITFHGND